MKNDLINEVWRVRDQMGVECGYDVTRFATLVRGEEVKAGKRLVHSPKAAARGKRAVAAA